MEEEPNKSQQNIKKALEISLPMQEESVKNDEIERTPPPSPSSSSIERVTKCSRISRVEKPLPDIMLKKGLSNTENQNEESLDNQFVERKILENKLKLCEEGLFTDDDGIKRILSGSYIDMPNISSNNPQIGDHSFNNRILNVTSSSSSLLEMVNYPAQLADKYAESDAKTMRQYGGYTSTFRSLIDKNDKENAGPIQDTNLGKTLKDAMLATLKQKIHRMISISSRVKILKDTIRSQNEETQKLDKQIKKAESVKKEDVQETNLVLKVSKFMDFLNKTFNLRILSVNRPRDNKELLIVRAKLGLPIIIEFQLRKGKGSLYVRHAECSCLQRVSTDFRQDNPFSRSETWQVLFNRYIYLEINDPKESSFSEFLFFLAQQTTRFTDLAREIDRNLLQFNVAGCEFDSRNGCIDMKMIATDLPTLGFVIRIECFQKGQKSILYKLINMGMSKEQFKRWDRKEIIQTLDLIKMGAYNKKLGSSYLTFVMQGFDKLKLGFGKSSKRSESHQSSSAKNFSSENRRSRGGFMISSGQKTPQRARRNDHVVIKLGGSDNS